LLESVQQFSNLDREKPAHGDTATRRLRSPKSILSCVATTANKISFRFDSRCDRGELVRAAAAMGRCPSHRASPRAGAGSCMRQIVTGSDAPAPLGVAQKNADRRAQRGNRRVVVSGCTGIIAKHGGNRRLLHVATDGWPGLSFVMLGRSGVEPGNGHHGENLLSAGQLCRRFTKGHAPS